MSTVSGEDRARWEKRYREEGPPAREPSPFVVSARALLPERGRALDVAGGAGRHALWLARAGLEVMLIDISETALGLARADAEREGLALETLACDLDVEPLPAGPWDVVVSYHYLNRDLFARWPAVLRPGGLLVFVQPTRVNLERHPRPPAAYLLAPGELATLVEGLEIVHLEEGWGAEGRHEARLIARLP
jgi:tellurite methyltransferase